MGKYDNYASGPSGFGTGGAVLTPGNDDIAGEPKAVVCLTAGNLTIVPEVNADSAALAFVGVPAGFVPPFRVRRLTAATATVASVLD